MLALPARIRALVPLLLAALLAEGRASAEGLPEQLRSVPVRSRFGMVVTGHPEASRAGARVLEEGGNAVDAAVAAAFALGVADPGVAGPGGQATLLVRMASGETVVLDGAVSVPLLASVSRLKGMKDESRCWGWATVATPGMVAATGTAHARWGRLPWARVLAPAEELARRGFTLSASAVAFAESYPDKMIESEGLAPLLLGEGARVHPPSHLYCMDGAAATLRRLASAGWRDFYTGALAAEIDEEMRAQGGFLSRRDLARMRPSELEPVRGQYRSLEVLSAPYPAGGAALVLALNVLDRFEKERVARAGVDRIHLLLEASRAAHRKTYSDWCPAETSAVLAARREVAADLAAVIRPDRIQADAAFDPAPPAPAGNHGTTQLSVVDAEGNVVSMTLTLGRVWGAGVVSRLGFVWNGILEDFDVSGRATQAALVPYARPVTTVAPTLLVKEGAPFLVLGSAGSGRITSAVMQVVSEVVDRGKPLGEAISAPRVLWSGLGGEDRFYVEPVGEIGPAELRGMADRLYWEIYSQGFPARVVDLTAFGGVNAILVESGGALTGVGDPRRQGAAAAPNAPAPSPKK